MGGMRRFRDKDFTRHVADYRAIMILQVSLRNSTCRKLVKASIASDQTKVDQEDVNIERLSPPYADSTQHPTAAYKPSSNTLRDPAIPSTQVQTASFRPDSPHFPQAALHCASTTSSGNSCKIEKRTLCANGTGHLRIGNVCMWHPPTAPGRSGNFSWRSRLHMRVSLM